MVAEVYDAGFTSMICRPSSVVYRFSVVGMVLEHNFGSDLIDVGREIRNPEGKRVAEIDIELKFANVEVKSGARPVDMNQIDALTTNTLVNPNGLPLVIYAPQATPNQMKKIQSAGAMVVKDTTELINTLETVKKERKHQ